MTEAQVRIFLEWGGVLCAIMALVNLARYRRLGAAAIVMALAFLCLGLAGWLLAQRAPVALVYGLVGLVVVLNIIHFAIRSAERLRQVRKR